MGRLVFAFILLILSILLGIQLSQDPGYVLISINSWTVEMTLWVTISAIFIGFILFHLLFTVLGKLFHFPAQYREWKTKRKALHAQTKTRKGLIEFSEGYWAKAKNDLIKALPGTDTPLFNYLTAARAAQEMGDFKLRDSYLREAQQSMPEARIAVELTQAQLQLANQQWEQALATLRHLQDLAPKHPYVLKLLMHLYQEVRDWPQLLKLMPVLRRNNIISQPEFERLELHSYCQSIQDLVRLDQTEALNHLMNTLPRRLRDNAELISLYCSYLMARSDNRRAEEILRHSLKKQYDQKLIELYGQLHVDDKQLPFAESFIKKHADCASLYLCLGRLSIAQHLWGKAKSYLNKSIEMKPTSEAYAELGALYERFGEQSEASQAFRQGLRLKNDKLAEDAG